MAFKMKTIPEVLGFNAEHSEQKSIVFEKKLPKNVWGTIDMNGVIEINKNLNSRQKAKAVMHERLHLQQIRDGVLKFNRNNYEFKPKNSNKMIKVPTKLIDTRRRDLPWEVSVEQKLKQIYKRKK
jgi:hypothetical protein|tara:strand:+ start:369 stop:743 length:375 start_codon:yes stop_codon:yes gene_type:complete